MKKPFLIVVACSVLACLALMSVVDVIPPHSMTLSAITETVVRINLYSQRHNRLPDSLKLLPEREGYANRTTDGWGRKLRYSVDSNGIITLKSLGKDGQVGGTGDDADMVARYRTKADDGRFVANDDMWPVTGEIK